MSHALSRSKCRPRVGQRFSVEGKEYQLEGHLGDGAAGMVRKARRLRDNSLRAVKFLAPDPKYIDEAVFDDVAARFRREGQRGLFLEHQSLLKIYAYVENEDGQAFQSRNPKNPFIIMEAVRGQTLESYIRRFERRQEEKREPKMFSPDAERLWIALAGC